MTACWLGAAEPTGSIPRISSSERYPEPAAPACIAPPEAPVAAPFPISVPAQSRSTCVPLLIVHSSIDPEFYRKHPAPTEWSARKWHRLQSVGFHQCYRACQASTPTSREFAASLSPSETPQTNVCATFNHSENPVLHCASRNESRQISAARRRANNSHQYVGLRVGNIVASSHRRPDSFRGPDRRRGWPDHLADRLRHDLSQSIGCRAFWRRRRNADFSVRRRLNRRSPVAQHRCRCSPGSDGRLFYRRNDVYCGRDFSLGLELASPPAAYAKPIARKCISA